MAYGIKYRHSYCNEYGANSTVTILENGYSGAVKEIDAQEDPIVISQEGSDTDKFDTIRPSTASIGLIGSDDFKLEELFTADERKYMVENHVGGVMVWRGFVIPNGFSHEWTGGTFPMEIIASDNLSTLKDFQFLNDNGTVISGRMRHTDILLKCLNKLDISIDLLTLTGLDRQGGISGEDPVFINDTDVYTFLDTNVREEGVDFYFENPENAWNCEDVVRNICSIYGAKLYQSKGTWRFKRINVDYGASISGQTFHRYNTLGMKVGTVPYDEMIVIPCTDYSGEKAQYSGALLAMSEVYKSSSSRYGYRYRVAGDKLLPIIKNQELEYPFPAPPPATFTPLDWTISLPRFVVPPPTRDILISPELRPSGDFPPSTTGGAIRLYGGDRRGGDSLRSNVVSAINIKKNDRFSFSFWHKTPVGFFQGKYYRFFCLVRIIFKKNDSEKRWVLKNEDFVKASPSSPYARIHKPSWVEMVTTSNTSMTFISGETTYEWINEYLISQPVPEDGQITIEFGGIGFPEDSQTRPPDQTSAIVPAYLPVRDVGANEDYQVTYIQKEARIVSTEFKIGEMKSGVLKGQGSSSGRIYTSEQDAKFTRRGDREELATADVLDGNLIGGILTGGAFVDKWNDSRNPYPERMPLGMLLTQDVMRQYKNVWRVIEEDIKANGLSFDTTIEFEERAGERYVIQRGSISQKFNRLIGCTLIQVSANPDTAFVGSETIEEDFKSEGGSSGSSGGGGGGSGSAPQDLQSVTDIGSETTNIITARGLRTQELLIIPSVASNEAGAIHYGDGTGVIPEPDYVLPIATANVLGGVKIGNGLSIDPTTGVLTASFNPAGYATENWVGLNYVPQTRKVNGKALSADISITASDVGALTQVTADGRYIRNQIQLQAGANLHVEGGIFTKKLIIPSIEDDSVGAIWYGEGTGAIPVPDYILPIATATILGGIKVGDGLSIDANGVLTWSGTSGVTEQWVNNKLLDYVPNLRTVNGKALTDNIVLSAADVGALTQGTADGRYIRNQTALQTGANLHVVGGVFVNKLIIPSVASNDTGAVWFGDGTGAIPDPFVLPIASATVLGGIKVGNGLSINATTGVLTATAQPIDAYTKAQSDARYEYAFTKLTGFNKNFGTSAGTVAEGNDSRFHTHSNKSVLDQITQANYNNWNTAYGWGNHAGLYLPITGGTLTGGLWIDSNLRISKAEGINGGGFLFSVGGTGYNSYNRLYLGREDGTTALFTGNGNTIWHSGNLRSNAQSDTRYVLKSGDTMLGLAYNMLELKRNGATLGSSILFSNNSGRLGQAGFRDDATATGFILGGKGTDGFPDLLNIDYNGNFFFKGYGAFDFTRSEIPVFLADGIYIHRNTTPSVSNGSLIRGRSYNNVDSFIIRNYEVNDIQLSLYLGGLSAEGTIMSAPKAFNSGGLNSIYMTKHSAVSNPSPYLGGKGDGSSETFVLSTMAFSGDYQMRLSAGGLLVETGKIRAPTIQATSVLQIPSTPSALAGAIWYQP